MCGNIKPQKDYSKFIFDPKDLVLCLPNKLCFSGFGPLPADQAVPSSVAVGTLLFQEVVDPGGVAKT